ncbi:hypothetical protein ACVQ8P_05410 [Dellaglioa sp. BT-FLS60]
MILENLFWVVFILFIISCLVFSVQIRKETQKMVKLNKEMKNKKHKIIELLDDLDREAGN